MQARGLWHVEEAAGDVDDDGVELDDVDGHLWLLLQQQARKGSAAEADDQGLLWVVDEAQRQAGEADVLEDDPDDAL